MTRYPNGQSIKPKNAIWKKSQSCYVVRTSRNAPNNPTTKAFFFSSSSFKLSETHKQRELENWRRQKRVREMEFANFEASSSIVLCLCRICHEEEEEGATSMESPCACAGTLKFAHRRCIQRWCDEKGSTICEICLQKFEPGYTVTAPSPSMPHMIEVVITIRGSLEAARLNNELQNQAMESSAGSHQEPEHSEQSPASHHINSGFQSIAFMFTILFFLRHIVALILVGNDYYSSRFLFIFLLRAVGVLLPFYLILQLINIIKNAKKLRPLHDRDGESDNEDIEEQ